MTLNGVAIFLKVKIANKGDRLFGSFSCSLFRAPVLCVMKTNNTKNKSFFRQSILTLFYICYNTPIVAWRYPLTTIFIVIFTWGIIIPTYFYTILSFPYHSDEHAPETFVFIFIGFFCIVSSLSLLTCFCPVAKWRKGQDYHPCREDEKNHNKVNSADASTRR